MEEQKIGLGDGLVLEIEIAGEDGSEEDITGWEILFTAKKSLADSDEEAFYKTSITNHTDPANGLSLLQIPYTDLNKVGKYHCNLRFLDSNGDLYPESTEQFILNINKRPTQRSE